MKKSTFALIFTILITFSCIFASCNSDMYAPSDSEAESDAGIDHAEALRELEEQLLSLKQDQYISNSQRTEEIARLEQLIAELKKNNLQTDSEENKTESESDTNTNTDTESDKETDKAPIPSKFIYTTNGEEATLTGYNGNEANVTIPSYIDGYKITAIGDDAFSSTSVTSVIIPNTVTKIGWFAFKECSALKAVTVPDSVGSIGYSAFPQNSNGFTLICSSGSFAAKYANSYGINTTLIQ